MVGKYISETTKRNTIANRRSVFPILTYPRYSNNLIYLGYTDLDDVFGVRFLRLLQQALHDFCLHIALDFLGTVASTAR